jgi:hypothetical protein
MKSVLLSVIWFITTIGIFAQGTVVFNNRLGSTTHVYGGGDLDLRRRGNGPFDNPAGSTSYAGLPLIGANGLSGLYGAATTFAQLLAANGANQAEGNLLPATGITTFRTGAAAGNVAGITATLAGVPADSAVATLQMVAWDNSSGLYPTWTQASVAWAAGLIQAGTSEPFNVNAIGGQTNSAPVLDNLTSFSIYGAGIIIPEPSSFALIGLGFAALLILPRPSRFNLRVESRSKGRFF